MIRLFLAFTVVVAGPISAQEEPPEGCFCLAEDTELLPQVQKGCTRVKLSGKPDWRAVCAFADASGEIVVAPPITITEAWKILSSDHPDCSPCDPELRDTPSVPRL